MKNKLHARRNSIVWQVVYMPIGTLILILIISMTLCFQGVVSMCDQEAKNRYKDLVVSAKQLDAELKQLDHSVAVYISESYSFRRLSKLKDLKDSELFLECQYQTGQWMEDQVNGHMSVEGVMIYYENVNYRLFRGTANYQVHDYLTKQTAVDREFNHWEIVDLDGVYYLIEIKKYNEFYYGVWIPVNNLMEQFNLNEDIMPGEVYLFDRKLNYASTIKRGGGTLKNADFSEGINRQKSMGRSNYNLVAKLDGKPLGFGMVCTMGSLITNLPVTFMAMLILLCVSIMIVPLLLKWLNYKIARPIMQLDEAMQKVAAGDMDYRIQDTDSRYNNEIESLITGFNNMLDKIDELEVDLYKSKILEQKIKFKYISQMIRPHFVLNALNIIYTYREDEMPLVKKMVVYLMEYFRYIVYLKTDFVTLKQEMHHIEIYLSIQKERYLNAFDNFVQWDSEAADVLIPPLILQSFAENCLKYGKKDDEEFFIYILGRIEEDRLKITIADNGNGFSGDKLAQINEFIETREYNGQLGLGIQNAIERMDMLFEQRVEVHAYNDENGGAVFTIYIPITK